MQPASNPLFLWLVLIFAVLLTGFLDDERRMQMSMLSHRTGIPLPVMVVMTVLFLVMVTSPAVVCSLLPRVLTSP
jgi:hypothetical protein